MPGVTSVIGEPANVPGLGSVSVRLLIDPGRFDPAQLTARRELVRSDGSGLQLWVNAAVRIDGDLAARIAERARAAQADWSVEQRLALVTVVEGTPWLRARLLVLAGVAELARRGRQGGDAVWDPRLDSAVALALAASLPFKDTGSRSGPLLLSGLADRVAQERRAEAGQGAAPQAAHARIGTLLQEPSVDLHVALIEIERQLRAVGDHAAGVASRTLDVEIGARYRRLADDCAELAAAAAAALQRF